jgi:hypothetical protein
VANVSRHGRVHEPGGGGGERRYVASLMWRGTPHPANDNHCGISFGLLLPLAGSVLLLAAAAIWAVVA